MADRSMRFGGGATNKAAQARTPDTISSKDTVELLLGISEGPIKGPVDGPKTMYADGTALVNQDGTPNFTNFQVDFWPGVENGPPILMALGGFSSPKTIGVTLAQGVPVVRSGDQVDIDAVDYRVVVQQLMYQDKKGSHPTDLRIKFEYKPINSPTWLPAWSISDPVTVPGGDSSWAEYGNENLNAYSFLEDRELFTTSGPPTNEPSDRNAVSFDVTNTHAYVWDYTDGLWHLASLSNQGQFWTFTDAFDNSWRIYKMSTFAPLEPRTGDLWLNSPTALLIYNGANWVMGNSSAKGPTDSTPLVDGVWSVNAKVTSPTAKDIRIYIPKLSVPYEFRVTKLSDDSNSTTEGTDDTLSIVQWESIQEIQRKPWSFKALALTKILGQASDQFSALPEWSGDYEGRIVRVPSNYDPEERTYAGIWDGTYKLAYTNNPAFVLQDFIENDRYGLSSVYLHVPNKWSFYEFGQYCDEPLARPDGSMRPRWTFNDYITQARDAKEMAQYIAGAGGALYVDDGNGGVDIIIDRDGPSTAIYTPENVGEDGFSYSYTDRLSRPNQIIVEFANSKLGEQADKRIIRDEDDIETYGLISENFIAVGCTDIDEALARARRRLIGGLTEKEIVSFTTNRKGKYHSEMDIILVADPDMGRGMTGRIRAVTGNRSVSLRDPLTFESAIVYWATFDIVDEETGVYTTVRRRVTNTSGTHTSLSFDADLPELAPHAAFVIEADGIVGYPKPYRITNIQDDDGTGENIKITALELNRNKWVFIDTGVEIDDPDYDDHSGLVLPATNLRSEISFRPKGIVTTRVLTLSWDKSATSTVKSYTVTYARDGVTVSSLDTPNLTCEFEGIDRGRHTFTVVAKTVDDRLSAPAYFYYNLDGIQSLSPIQNLRLANGATETTFEEVDAVFAWDPIVDEPNFDHYEIIVLDEEETILRTVNVGTALTYTYSWLNNYGDHGDAEPPRTFTFGVRAVDNSGVISIPATIEVTNPPPAAPQDLMVHVQIGGFLIKWRKQSNTPDFGGTRIYMSQTPGAAADPENLIFDGPESQAVVTLPTAAGWQILVGHYDLYRPSETIFADEVAQNLQVLITDLTEDLQEALNAAAEAQEIVQGLSSGADELAETLIEEIMRTADEAQKVELATYLNGEKIGTYVLETKEEAENLLAFTSLMGAFNDDRSAIILRRDKVMYDEERSLAEVDELIEARFSGNSESFLLTQLLATADTAGASASSLSKLGADSPDGTSFVINSSTAKVGSQTFAQYVLGVSASVGNDAKAYADQKISALSPVGGVPTATFLQSVNTNVNGMVSNVSFLMSSVGGNQAMAVLALQSGNRITGFRVDGQTRDFGIMAERFYIVDPGNDGNAKLPFLFEGGIAYLEQVVVKYLRAEIVDTEQLKVGAAGSTTIAYGGNIGMSSGYQTVVSGSIYARGGMVQALFYGSLTVPSSRTHIWLQLQRNGSPIGQPQHISLDGQDTCPINIVFTDTGANNNDNNSYSVVRTDGSCSFDGCSLTLSNLRRFDT